MALATITGKLGDFGRASLSARSAELVFIPGGPTTTIDGGYLLSGIPIIVKPSSNGSWSVALEEYENMHFPAPVTLRIRTLDPDIGYIWGDFPDWKIYVPIGGGALTDIVQGPIGGGLTWDVPDDEIPEAAKAGDLMFNSTTSKLYRIG